MTNRHRRASPIPGLLLIGCIIALFVAAAVFGIRGFRSQRDPAHTAEIGAAQDLVKAKFGAAGHFAPLEETSFVPLEDGKVKVSGEVDQIAPSGASARYFYAVIMHRNPDGQWVADDISLVPI